MSKRALLVGINQFAGRPEWLLRGCVNDSQAMKQLLEEVYGFTEIRVLNDGDATRQGIEEGLAWLLSGYEGGGKDVRVFHFASHGTQVATQADDDVEEDQLDEVIVPHDHDWDKPFRDDELRAIFDNIPDDVNFTFLADCCHSGSVDKDVFPREWDVRPRRVEPPAEMQTRINRIAARRLEEETRWIDARMEEKLAGLTFRERRQQERGLRERLKALFWQERKKLIPAQRQTLLAACEDVQTAA
ncbi:MAG: caspase family protein, partial [Caldilineae bacterium]